MNNLAKRQKVVEEELSYNNNDNNNNDNKISIQNCKRRRISLSSSPRVRLGTLGKGWRW